MTCRACLNPNRPGDIFCEEHREALTRFFDAFDKFIGGAGGSLSHTRHSGDGDPLPRANTSHDH